jgi:hypothetical protein
VIKRIKKRGNKNKDKENFEVAVAAGCRLKEASACYRIEFFFRPATSYLIATWASAQQLNSAHVGFNI